MEEKMDQSSGEKMLRWKGEKLPAWKLSCKGNLRGEKELNVFQEKEKKKKKEDLLPFYQIPTIKGIKVQA